MPFRSEHGHTSFSGENALYRALDDKTASKIDGATHWLGHFGLPRTSRHSKQPQSSLEGHERQIGSRLANSHLNRLKS